MAGVAEHLEIVRTTLNDLTAVSLFSGVGGLDHGLARAGFRHLLLCESDPWRRDVLRARFPVFIVGARADGDPRAAAHSAGEVLAVGTRCPGHPPTGGETRPDVAGTLGGGSGERGWAQDPERMTFVASPLEASDGHHGLRGDGADNLIAAPLSHGSNPISAENLAQPSTRRNGDPGVVQYGASVRRLTPIECERLQALPDGWTDLGDTPDSRRYAALGDAVTASVAEWIGRRIAAAMARTAAKVPA